MQGTWLPIDKLGEFNEWSNKTLYLKLDNFISGISLLTFSHYTPP